MKPLALPVALLLSILAVNAACAETHIGDDRGGSLGKYLLMFAAIRDSGERVIIDGDCFSACTLVTAMIPKSRICITDRAALGFHASWFDDETGNRIASSEGTRLLYVMYPSKIRSWITRHGGLGTRTIVLKGRELADFYATCE